MKKSLIILIICIMIGTSVFTSTGNLAPDKLVISIENIKKEKPEFWETLSKFEFDNNIYYPIKNHEPNFLQPSINFPLPGEVFRLGDIIEINGTTSMPDFQNYIIEWGIGLNPTEWFTNGITLVANGTMEITNATLGFWDTNIATEAEFYTIKLTINLIDLDQYIINVSIYLDPTLHINFPFGWPHEIQGSQVAIWSPIAISDINNDGFQEIGFGTVTVESVGDNNYDYVIDHMGNILNGWPIQLYAIQGASLTFANINFSTNNEEVIGGMWGDKIFIWHDNGSLVNGWPKNVYASRASVTVNDIDCDGDSEIILPTVDGGGQIYAFHHDATIVDGWPVYIGSPIRCEASTADIDYDGFPEILFGDQKGYVYALHHDGTFVDGWPQQAHDFIKSSPVISDIEGDGDLEIIISSGFTQQRIISAWHHDGIMVDGWPKENGLSFVQPSVGDIDNDGDLEILAGGAIQNTTIGRFFVWHHDGSIFEGWPITFEYSGPQYYDFIYAQPIIGDIDGDDDVEIIVGSYNKKLYAWHNNATKVTGWPKIIGDYVDSTAAIADIDNDNLVEVVVAGDDGKIYLWDLEVIYNSSNMEWPMFQYDSNHTGYYNKKHSGNQPPSTPIINGSISGKAGNEYSYRFFSLDPQGDNVYFYIDWDDGTNTGWIGPFISGQEQIIKHTWNKKGVYTIQAKAKDRFGAVSGLGTLEVTMPKDKAININFNLFSWLFKQFPILEKILKFQ